MRGICIYVHTLAYQGRIHFTIKSPFIKNKIKILTTTTNIYHECSGVIAKLSLFVFFCVIPKRAHWFSNWPFTNMLKEEQGKEPNDSNHIVPLVLELLYSLTQTELKIGNKIKARNRRRKEKRKRERGWEREDKKKRLID